MKAWMLTPSTKELSLADRPLPKPRRGTAIVRIEAAMVLGYNEGGAGRRAWPQLSVTIVRARHQRHRYH